MIFCKEATLKQMSEYYKGYEVKTDKDGNFLIRNPVHESFILRESKYVGLNQHGHFKFSYNTGSFQICDVEKMMGVNFLSSQLEVYAGRYDKDTGIFDVTFPYEAKHIAIISFLQNKDLGIFDSDSQELSSAIYVHSAMADPLSENGSEQFVFPVTEQHWAFLLEWSLSILSSEKADWVRYQSYAEKRDILLGSFKNCARAAERCGYKLDTETDENCVRLLRVDDDTLAQMFFYEDGAVEKLMCYIVQHAQ